MSIVGYAGLPGAGKSYSLIANVVIPALKERRYVAHNLMLNEAALQVVCDPQDGKPFDVHKLLIQIPKLSFFQEDPDYPKDDEEAARVWVCDRVIEHCRPGAVICLDEVWEYWPQGLNARDMPRHHLEFFKKHRHRVDSETGHSSEIIIIDQDLESGVASVIRKLIDLTYLHTKLDKVGAKGKFRVDVYNRAQSSDKPKKSALVRQLVGTYKPEVWNCYVSHTESSKPFEAGLEKAPDRRGSVLKSMTVKAAVAAAFLLPVAGYWAWQSVQSLGNSGGTRRAPQASTASAQSAPSAVAESSAGLVPVAPSPNAQATPQAAGSPLAASTYARHAPGALQAVPDPLKASQLWRLMGVIFAEGGTPTALVSSATGRRRLDSAVCEPFERDYRCKVEDGWAYFWSGAARQLSAALPEGTGDDSGAPLPKSEVKPGA